jgi:5'-nucleotidase
VSRLPHPPVDRPSAGAGLGHLLILTGAISASAHGSGSSSLKGLKILLTNDDSMQAARPNNSDGLGLYEIRRSLCLPAPTSS